MWVSVREHQRKGLSRPPFTQKPAMNLTIVNNQKHAKKRNKEKTPQVLFCSVWGFCFPSLLLVMLHCIQSTTRKGGCLPSVLPVWGASVPSLTNSFQLCAKYHLAFRWGKWKQKAGYFLVREKPEVTRCIKSKSNATAGIWDEWRVPLFSPVDVWTAHIWHETERLSLYLAQ